MRRRTPKKLTRSFYCRPTVEVARELLGKYLVYRSDEGVRSARLVEVEAYIGEEDPACHAAPGKTSRNAIMYNSGGFSYIYKIYGVYNCLNFVTERAGYPAAVLVRAGEPSEGYDLMKLASPNDAEVSILRGPGKLCRAFELSREQNGIDLTSAVLYVEDRFEPEVRIGVSSRIGITKASDWPLRFFDMESHSVSGKGTGRATDLRATRSGSSARKRRTALSNQGVR